MRRARVRFLLLTLLEISSVALGSLGALFFLRMRIPTWSLAILPPGVDGHYYAAMAEGALRPCLRAPFCWRPVVPVIAGLRPFETTPAFRAAQPPAADARCRCPVLVLAFGAGITALDDRRRAALRVPRVGHEVSLSLPVVDRRRSLPRHSRRPARSAETTTHRLRDGAGDRDPDEGSGAHHARPLLRPQLPDGLSTPRS